MRARACAHLVRRTRGGRIAGALLAGALLAAVSLAACSGSQEAAPKVPPAQQLAAAKAKVDAATSFHLTLRSSGIPPSASGALGADGSGTHSPAFKGILEARISGLQVKVDVVAINKLVYVKLPFTSEFIQADPKAYNAPDPAQLFATDGGISSLLTATVKPVEGTDSRLGPDVLKQIKGTLPGASVVKLLNIGDATKTFDVTYGITDPGGELRRVTMTGPFYKTAPATEGTSIPPSSTYVLTLDRYGAPVEISKP